MFVVSRSCHARAPAERNVHRSVKVGLSTAKPQHPIFPTKYLNPLGRTNQPPIPNSRFLPILWFSRFLRYLSSNLPSILTGHRPLTTTYSLYQMTS